MDVLTIKKRFSYNSFTKLVEIINEMTLQNNDTNNLMNVTEETVQHKSSYYL